MGSLVRDNPYADDPFVDLIRAQAALEDQLEITRRKEIPIYLTGTYSPTYLGSVTPGTTTYTVQDGFWVRIGQVIFYDGRVTWTAATGTGNAQISLPFTAQNTAGMRYSGDVRLANVTFANGSPEVRIEAGQALFTMDSPLTNGASTIVQIEAAGDVIFSGWFRV